MKTKRHPPSNKGFTRADLCVLLAGSLLLALMLLPAIATTKPRGDLVSCKNNLRQMGVGWISWSSEHQNRPLWYVEPSEGGTRTLRETWMHILPITNSLPNPCVLVCPDDKERVPARNFSDDTHGGFASTNHQNRAVSYYIGLELEMNELAILAGDRQISGATDTASCHNPGLSGVVTKFYSGAGATWNPTLHRLGVGNLLFTDGSVRTVDNAGVRYAIWLNPADGNKSGCALKPIAP